MMNWKSVIIGRPDVKKIELDGGVLWELAPGVVLGTTTATGQTVTVTGLPFTPTGVMMVSLEPDTKGGVIRGAVYAPEDERAYYYKSSAERAETHNFVGSFQSGGFTLGNNVTPAATAAKWPSGTKYYIAWGSGAGAYGNISGSGKTLTVSGLGFLPKGVFAFTTISTTSNASIRFFQKDTDSEVTAVLADCAGGTAAASNIVLTVSDGSATFGSSSTRPSFPSAGRTEYFIWK